MRPLVFLALLPTLCIARLSSAQSLTDLEDTAKSRPTDFDSVILNQRALRTGVRKLIADDALKTASDFRRAGLLQLEANEDKEATVSTGYQLLLVALALGDRETSNQIGRAWDRFLMATGRYRRIGVEKTSQRLDKGDEWWVDPAPEVIRRVYASPAAARAKAAASKDNLEVQRIVDADQKARQVDWNKLTQAQLMQLSRDDRDRFHRIKEIISNGGLRTGVDFFNAALVCQHGEVFMDYAFAHELAVCGMILGNKQSSWLAGASFDRMLLSAGYLQAFDTQYLGNWHLDRFTTVGINDRMRKAVVHTTLADSQARDKNPLKG